VACPALGSAQRPSQIPGGERKIVKKKIYKGVGTSKFQKKII
jgi:hypothetical protein